MYMKIKKLLQNNVFFSNEMCSLNDKTAFRNRYSMNIFTNVTNYFHSKPNKIAHVELLEGDWRCWTSEVFALITLAKFHSSNAGKTSKVAGKERSNRPIPCNQFSGNWRCYSNHWRKPLSLFTLIMSLVIRCLDNSILADTKIIYVLKMK